MPDFVKWFRDVKEDGATLFLLVERLTDFLRQEDDIVSCLPMFSESSLLINDDIFALSFK
jgi:hypothetical protein